jgi:hypothetical protein
MCLVTSFSPSFTPASGTILLCCIHFNQEFLFCGCNCCLSDNIEVLCRRKGSQDSGIDLSGAEKVQLPREYCGIVCWEGQQQRFVCNCSGWVSPVQAAWGSGCPQVRGNSSMSTDCLYELLTYFCCTEELGNAVYSGHAMEFSGLSWRVVPRVARYYWNARPIMPHHWKTCISSGFSVELVDHCSAWPLAVPVFCKHVIYMCTCDQGYSILYTRTDESKGYYFLLVIITNHILAKFGLLVKILGHPLISNEVLPQKSKFLSFGTTGYTQLSLHAVFCICSSWFSHVLLGRLLWVASCAPNVPSPWSSRMAIWFPQAALWMSTLTVLWGMCFCGRWDTFSPLVRSNL